MKKTMDGNQAAAYISYALSELAAIYPITPSSTMAEYVDEWQAMKKENVFGSPLEVVEMQSEAGAAGTVHGMLKSGSLTTTYTASQGLLLMIPNMYKIAGELLPTVFHVASRAVAAAALNIFGDHSDVMSTRSTGFCMLFESSVQEVMDLSAVAHLASIEASLPFLNSFDGFRTSHELQKIEVIDYDDLKPLINHEKLSEFRQRAMNPDHPTASGQAQNPDIFFQQRETVNQYYEKVPQIVQKYMRKINEIRGTDYDLVNYYGDPEATEVIIAIGSAGQAIEQTVDYLNANGRSVGFLNIHLYRPFPVENFLEKLPDTVKQIAVLDRTKEPGSDGEPLLLDVQSVIYRSNIHPTIIGGRYGLGSKDVTPAQIIAVYEELLKDEPKSRFTIGIKDEVTNLSLEEGKSVDLTSATTFQAKFWGFGSDGTVGANKSAIKIIGDHTDRFVQGYFSYDSKKSGGLTVSHLRFGNEPIKSTYLIQHADFVAVHSANYVHQYEVLKGLKPNGVFLLNTLWTDEQLERHLPARVKRYIAENNIQFYTINAVKIAENAGLGRRINTAMQVGFFKLAKIMPFDEVLTLLKQDAHDSYAKKSMSIVESNIKAIDDSVSALHHVEIPVSWKDAETPQRKTVQENGKAPKQKYVFKIVNTVNAQEGDTLSVGDLIDNKMQTGDMPLGTTAFEKRGIALQVPEWNEDKCTQCNICAFVCPHAAIRPFLANEEEMTEAPDGFIVREMRGADGLKYRIQVSVEDCTGCGLCVEACPAKGKALEMKPYEAMKNEAINWAFAMTLKQKENPAKPGSLLHYQFNKPLIEFSGACAGCGETPYIKLLTQMFGDRMVMANATGCSSIYGGSSPVTPYTTNEAGQGPAWSNSLFEDNAEFGFGMYVSNYQKRNSLAKLIKEIIKKSEISSELIQLLEDWLMHKDESSGTRQRAEKLKSAIEEEMAYSKDLTELFSRRDQFVKPSQWIIGGDGWAYDIGYGGIDHVIASGADINILVMDNEVYANTGGQVSKATPKSAVAKFAAGGKFSAKKDLGMMAVTYGNVYVAQIASGANTTQTIKAFEEAEKYPGPSIIIAYTPCISHGLKGGMSNTLNEAKEAVNSGFWSLYRYNPLLVEKGKSPMTLDFKRPDFSTMKDYFSKQVRFSGLKRVHLEMAEEMYDKTIADAKRRFINYATLSGDIEKIQKRWEKEAQQNKKSADDLEETDNVKAESNKERKEQIKDPEANARRLARRAKRQAKRNNEKS